MSERNPPPEVSAGEPEDTPAYLAPMAGATAMKAFAHPLRMRMYDYLSDHGSATATMLARHTGESTGQTSYHLRQLERHGFVAEDPARGTGRERWWTAVGFSMRGDELARDSGTRPAVELVLHNQIEQRGRALAEWYQRGEEEDPAWKDTTTNTKNTISLTAEEAGELTDEMMQLLHQHTERARDRRKAGSEEGVRRVRVYLDIFPLSPPD